jgi:hypothetical protein
MRKLIVSMIDLIIHMKTIGGRSAVVVLLSEQKTHRPRRLRLNASPVPNAIKHAFPTTNKLAI